MPNSNEILASPSKVIKGIVESTAAVIITVLVTCVAALPAASLTLYVIVYVPTVFTSTGFTVAILEVISPSVLSNAVAPAST